MDKDRPPATDDKITNHKLSVGSNDETPKPTTCSILPMERYPLEISSTSKINNTTQELFLDSRFGVHDNRPSDHMLGLGYFSYQQLNYATNNNNNNNNMELTANPNNNNNNNSLCFIPGSTCSQILMSESDINSSITNNSTMLHSLSTSIFPKHTVTVSNPSINSISSDGVHNWEASSSSNTHAHVEDIKWSEYLNAPFLLGNTVLQHHHQNTTQSIYSDVDEIKLKQETGGFITEDQSSNTIWHHNNSQQQQHFQPSDIYSKDLPRYSLAFGQTL